MSHFGVNWEEVNGLGFFPQLLWRGQMHFLSKRKCIFGGRKWHYFEKIIVYKNDQCQWFKIQFFSGSKIIFVVWSKVWGDFGMGECSCWRGCTSSRSLKFWSKRLGCHSRLRRGWWLGWWLYICTVLPNEPEPIARQINR